MGHIGEVALRIVAAHLQTLIGLEADILEPMDVPSDSYQPARRQYDAGLILKRLAGLAFPHSLRVLTLTTVDLCNPILTHVYGEAAVGGKLAIVSNFRLRHSDDGTTASLDRYYERLAKVSLHEVAHTLSLYHCETPKCLMRFSPRVHHLDELDICFCDRCEFMLRESLKAAQG